MCVFCPHQKPRGARRGARKGPVSEPSSPTSHGTAIGYLLAQSRNLAALCLPGEPGYLLCFIDSGLVSSSFKATSALHTLQGLPLWWGQLYWGCLDSHDQT